VLCVGCCSFALRKWDDLSSPFPWLPKSDRLPQLLNNVPQHQLFSSICAGVAHGCGLGNGTAIPTCWDVNGTFTMTGHGPLATITCGAATVTMGTTSNGTAVCFQNPNSPQIAFEALCEPLFNLSRQLDVSETPAGWTQLVTYESKACGIRLNGALYCWGDRFAPDTANLKGQLFVQLDINQDYGCAITTEGVVQCWGMSFTRAIIPVAAGIGKRFVSVHTSDQHACAVAADGSFSCWGEASDSYPDATLRYPADTRFKASVQTLITSSVSDHVCGLTSDRRAVCWGSNVYGQCTSPASKRFASLCTTYSATCGTSNDTGEVICWGASRPSAWVALNSTGGLFWKTVGCGDDYVCATSSNYSGRCFLIDPNQADRIPARRTAPTPDVPVQSVVGSVSHTLWLTTQGTTLFFGESGGDGQSDSDASGPLPVPGGRKYKQIAAARHRSCGLVQGTDELICNGIKAHLFRNQTNNNPYFHYMAMGAESIVGWRTDGSVYCYDNLNSVASECRGPTALPSTLSNVQSVASGVLSFTCVSFANGTSQCYGQGSPVTSVPPSVFLPLRALRGQYQVGARVYPCPLGTFSQGDGAFTSLCSGPCRAGRYGNTTGLDSSDCSGACPRGSYCPTGTAQPIPCKAGFVCNLEGQVDSVDACPAGFFCPKGTADANSFPCPAGRFGNATGLLDANCSGACRPGHWCPSASTTPDKFPCSTGTFVTDEGGSICELCPSGKFANSTGAVQCQACEAGFIAPAMGAATCIPCSAGYFSNDTLRKECWPCASGKFANSSGQTHCGDCWPGSYADGEGAVTCVPCSPGFFLNHTQGKKCQLCVPGTFVNVSSQTVCSDCLPGFYASGTGNVQCVPCAPGTYARSQAQKGCQDCALGFFANASASITCAPCASGYISTEYGSARCLACGKGRFQNATGKSTCANCPDNFHAQDEGSAMCVECPRGRLTNSLTDHTQCQPCSDGTYLVSPPGQNSTDERVCRPCPEHCKCSALQSDSDDVGVTANDGYYLSFDPQGHALVSQCAPGHCIAGSKCAAGRKHNSTLCNECEAGLTEWNGKCVACDGTNGGLITVLVLAMFCCVALLHWLTRRSIDSGRPTAHIKIVM